ncbi:MAG: hypothetical protein JXA95_05140 [Spirochaetales bacterium]|nr:hypothetical protein [Spirochaetales bacterium]
MGKGFLLILAILVLSADFLLYAMPENLKGDPEGWVEVSLGYAYAMPLGENHKGGHNFSLNFSFVNHDNLGWGGTVKFGQSLVEVSLNLQNRYFTANDVGMPVYYKFGLICPDEMHLRLGAGIEGGINYYFNEKVDTENKSEAQYEYHYTYTELMGGLFVSIGLKEKDRFLFIPEALINLGYATTPYPDSGVHYSYY